MTVEYTVNVCEIIKEFSLEILYAPADYKSIEISSRDVNRPGLALNGFFLHFDARRIQVIGLAESKYLESLDSKMRIKRISDFFSYGPSVIIITTSIEPCEELLACAAEKGVLILRTSETTSAFVAALIASLNLSLAPRSTQHGVLVEVYGEGILIRGDSGVGKSETAIELLKRGHRLIADDAVEIKKVSATTLVGCAPEIIRHYVELRGVGIVDVRRLFGMGAVKETEKIDMVINLEPWENGKMYDRLGLDEETTEILGINVPSIVLPVCPGRNLSVVIEVAAMNNRQKRMGYNTAKEFNKRLMESMGVE